MAVCKIIPIKQSRGVAQCLDYIADDKKTIAVPQKEQNNNLNPTKLEVDEEEALLTPMDFHAVLAYMSNEEKTKDSEDTQKKYISGYMCNPETAVQEFLKAKEDNLAKQSKRLSDETGNWAYHIIQSFPENLNISDEEVHQCGRELCEKLRDYQAVICSHIHPVINDKNEVSGKCKHNHILINSHIHPEKIDPQNPGVFKYNNCRETYAQLQQWNDEISLAHGLPIIRNPDLNKKYSWFKSKMENEDASWTKRVAMDIKNTMRFCSNWEDFKKQMIAQGYSIRETNKNITYYTPEHSETHKQQIREKRLGKEYTKVELERYWANVGKAKDVTLQTESGESKSNLIESLVAQYDTNLFAEVITRNKNKTYTLDIPIKNPRREISEMVMNTYFEAEKTYNLSTSDHVPIAQVTGQDLFDYYEQIRQEKERKKEQEKLEPDTQEYFYDKSKINHKTNRPYRIRLWDETGHRRTQIELRCILAMVIIKNEHDNGDVPVPTNFRTSDGRIFYAKTDWKLQNMYNTMALAKEMNVENAQEVEQKLDRAGKEVARKRKQFNSLSKQFNQMETINEQLEAMNAVKDICEKIYNMPDGETKEAAMAAHATELEQYKTSKHYLHMKNISTEEQTKDFQKRYSSVSKHHSDVKSELETANQEYRNLRKINYNLTLAQNNYYCYGPTHPSLAEQQQEQPVKNDQLNDKQ